MTQKIAFGARVIMGLIFVIFGLNGFLHFMPTPPLTPPAQAFLSAMMATGYILPMVKATEIIGGAMLLSGGLAPLGLVFLAPVIVNILAFHLFLDPAGLPMATILTVLEAFLGFAYFGRFRSLFG